MVPERFRTHGPSKPPADRIVPNRSGDRPSPFRIVPVRTSNNCARVPEPDRNHRARARTSGCCAEKPFCAATPSRACADGRSPCPPRICSGGRYADPWTDCFTLLRHLLTCSRCGILCPTEAMGHGPAPARTCPIDPHRRRCSRPANSGETEIGSTVNLET